MNWTQRYNYNFPTSIRFGSGVIDELADHLKSVGKRAPLIVTDKMLTTLPFFKTILDQLSKTQINVTVFDDVDKNPVEKNVLEGVNTFQNSKCDSVIGLGGGASMDVARAIVLKAYHDRPLFDFDDSLGGDKYVTQEIPYFITVPTTSGTGSEVGRSAVIAENDTHKKRILFSPRLMAAKVFADPSLTLALPAPITAATGMDALSHNLEAYLSKGFSPLCDGIAIEAIRLIADSLEGATNSPSLENRSKMMMAALMGATAFQKGLGIVHSLAHPLSTVYDIHHGLANAIMLPFGIEFNAEVSKAQLEYLCTVLGLEKSAIAFKHWVVDLNKKLKMPDKLSSVGVTAEGMEKLSQLAIDDVCHQSNPRVVTMKDFKQIYTKAL